MGDMKSTAAVISKSSITTSPVGPKVTMQFPGGTAPSSKRAAGSKKKTVEIAWQDLGPGCCANPTAVATMFNAFLGTLQECQAMCTLFASCGYIEHGWKDSSFCRVYPKGVDCSNLRSGALDCGKGGGNTGVHVHKY